MSGSTRLVLLGCAACLPLLSHAAAQSPSREDFEASSAARRSLRQGCYFAADQRLRQRAFDAVGLPRSGFAHDRWGELQAVFSGMPAGRGDARRLGVSNPKVVGSRNTFVRRDAIETIVERARATRLVILNEDHAVPENRAFALRVAKALRPLGYDVLAVETLTNVPSDAEAAKAMDRLTAEGYPRPTTGTYLIDPVFADFLRQALRAGYRPLPYEATTSPTSSDPVVNMERRESEQAGYVLRRALEGRRDSRVLLYVGFDHAIEKPVVTDGTTTRWLATRLKEATGIDPLTIDQTMLNDGSDDVARLPMSSGGQPRRSSVVFDHGRPLVLGKYAGLVDLQVRHPSAITVAGRPSWLLGMGRSVVPVPRRLLPTRGRRLIQAFVQGENGSVPIDQVMVDADTPAPAMMLPRRRVIYAYQDASTACPGTGST